MGVHLLWMVTSYFRPVEPLSIQRGDIQIPVQGMSSRHQVLLYPEDRPLRSKTYAANDTVELFCPWCESLPLTATALSHGNSTEGVFNFSYHDFLVVWSKVIKTTKLGDSFQPPVPYMARHRDRPSMPPWAPKYERKSGLRPKEIGPQRASIRAASTAPQIVSPSASGLASLCPEVRNVLHMVIFDATPISSVQKPPVR